MQANTCKPITFAERFPSPQLQSEVLTNNHAAGITYYCSECGTSLGYMPFAATFNDTCPTCGAAVAWDELTGRG